MKKLFFLLFIISISSNIFSQSNHLINSEEARQIAEKFVACSGYTTKTLQLKECGKYKINCNDQTTPCRFLKKRAFGYFPERQNGEKGWTIVFRKRGKLKSKITGVQITMNLDGTDVKIEETKVFLKYVEKKY